MAEIFSLASTTLDTQFKCMINMEKITDAYVLNDEKK